MGILGAIAAVGLAFQHNWVLAVGMGLLTAGAATTAYRLWHLENQVPPPQDQ